MDYQSRTAYLADWLALGLLKWNAPGSNSRGGGFVWYHYTIECPRVNPASVNGYQ